MATPAKNLHVMLLGTEHCLDPSIPTIPMEVGPKPFLWSSTIEWGLVSLTCAEAAAMAPLWTQGSKGAGGWKTCQSRKSGQL